MPLCNRLGLARVLYAPPFAAAFGSGIETASSPVRISAETQCTVRSINFLRSLRSLSSHFLT